MEISSKAAPLISKFSCCIFEITNSKFFSSSKYLCNVKGKRNKYFSVNVFKLPHLLRISERSLNPFTSKPTDPVSIKNKDRRIGEEKLEIVSSNQNFA